METEVVEPVPLWPLSFPVSFPVGCPVSASGSPNTTPYLLINPAFGTACKEEKRCSDSLSPRPDSVATFCSPCGNNSGGALNKRPEQSSESLHALCQDLCSVCV